MVLSGMIHNSNTVFYIMWRATVGGFGMGLEDETSEGQQIFHHPIFMEGHHFDMTSFQQYTHHEPSFVQDNPRTLTESNQLLPKLIVSSTNSSSHQTCFSYDKIASCNTIPQSIAIKRGICQFQGKTMPAIDRERLIRKKHQSKAKPRRRFAGKLHLMLKK